MEFASGEGNERGESMNDTHDFQSQAGRTHPMIGVFGTAKVASSELGDLAGRIGCALARAGCGVITGACSGLPYRAAHAASALGAPVVGFSPMHDIDGQREFVPEDDPAIYTSLLFTPRDIPFAHDLLVRKKYRNVVSTATCDAGIIIAGEWGTLNELTNLIDFRKPVGVLRGTGGIADAAPELARSLPGGERIMYESDPERLVGAIVARLRSI